MANVARRHAANIPWRCCLHAQSAQLDRTATARAPRFRAMAEREDTRLLGLRGLFIEAQRAGRSGRRRHDRGRGAEACAGIDWASQAVLGFRCAQDDWSGRWPFRHNLASG